MPTITMTMEITMATIGRLIKNFDIGLPSLRLFGKRLGVHLHARTQLLHSFDNHALALLQPVRNNPLRAHTVANFDRSNAHFVFAVHNRNLVAALQLRNRALRNKQRVFLHSDQRSRTCRTRRDAECFQDWEIARRSESPRCSDSPGGPQNKMSRRVDRS